MFDSHRDFSAADRLQHLAPANTRRARLQEIRRQLRIMQIERAGWGRGLAMPGAA